MADLVRLVVHNTGMGKGLFRLAVIRAWNKVSGAGELSSGFFLRNGSLTVIVSSSVVRSRLLFSRDWLLEALNAELENDERVKMSGETAKIEKLILH